MKRIIKLTFVFILSIIALSVFSIANIETNAEGIKDAKGYSVCYPGSKTAITVPNYEKQATEFRSVWVSFIVGDIRSYENDEQMKEQLLAVLANMEKYHMNAIMFHIRTHNDAMYDTELAPQSSYVEGMDYDRFDYLEWFINECHKRGIEFHAWLNPYRLSSSATTMEAILSKYKDYENNPAHYAENILINSEGNAILDPGRPAVQDYIVDVCMEIIEKYDVDAIHFDDYFYISDVDDSETRSLYNTNGLSVEDFRRESVDNFIYKLSTSIEESNEKTNRCVQLGISPSGIYRNAGTSTYVSPANYRWDEDGNLIYPIGSFTNGYAHYGSPLYCDTKKWIENSWIDYILPQVYWSFDETAACYASVVEWWNAAVKNTDVNLYIGTGLYKKRASSSGLWYTDENEWYNQLRFNQKNTYVDGTCVFQYKYLLTYMETECAQKVINECFTNYTKLPVLERYEGTIDTSYTVTDLKLYKANDSIALTWSKIDNAKNYLVYQYSDTLDINNPEQIIDMAGNDSNSNTCICNFTYDSSKGNNFAVIPVTKANELCQSKSISLTEASKFDENNEIINYNGYTIAGTIAARSRANLIFYEPTIIYGTSATYKVYYVYGTKWDEIKKQELKVTNNSGDYYALFPMNDHGEPLILRILGTTDFGSVYSDDILVSINYDEANKMFKAIFAYIDEMFNDFYGEEDE